MELRWRYRDYVTVVAADNIWIAVAFAVFAYLWFRSQQMTFPQAETGP
jgi:hypothetical protein